MPVRACVGARPEPCAGAGLVGGVTCATRARRYGQYGRGRHRPSGRAGRQGRCSIAAQRVCSSREGPGSRGARPIRGGCSRVRDGERDQSRLATYLRLARRVQILERRDRGRDSARRASDRRQSPRYLPSALVPQHRRAHLVQSRTNEALGWLADACNANPEYPTVHAWLAAAYALNGESEPAAAELAQARGLSRDGRYSSMARLKAL